MTAMNKRKLDTDYLLIVENISFASTEIGHATLGRTATTPWSAAAEVVFKGKLKHILIFAVMAFDVSTTSVNELFTLIPASDYTDVDNLTAADIVDVIDLDPTAGENIVLANDITFLENLTNNYRFGWDDAKNLILQEKAVVTNKPLFSGTPLQALCYAMQVSTAVIYTLWEFALLTPALNQGATYPTLTGANGPTELEVAHTTLAGLILNA